MKSIHLITAIAVALALFGCKENSAGLHQEASEVGAASFARTTFEALARGEPAAADRIDWQVLTSLGNNVGVRYIALTSEVEKEKFITGFITQFATSFRESGGKIEDFINWRVTTQNDIWKEVAADSPNGDLTVIVAKREGRERVTSINILK